MQKIPTLFQRDPENRKTVLPEVTPGCEWVLAGEGKATRKYDGTCVKLTRVPFGSEGRSLLVGYARREVKPGKTAPAGFVEVAHDPVTGKTVGWEPIEQSSFAKYYNEAANAFLADWSRSGKREMPNEFTCELIGPKVNGNPEKTKRHMLIEHGADVFHLDFEPSYEALKACMQNVLGPTGIEGIVWHHPDGRMAKLKVRDFS